MKYLIVAIFIAMSALPTAAFAGQAEVRDVAISNNCSPKKVEVYKQVLGADGETIYRIQCNIAKVTGDNGGTPQQDTILVTCKQNMCEFLRAMTGEKK
ncbi:MAG: hypothetical protein JO126_04140 [Alphaproteobacteria bacterium]|nr:hypothetical protein [Alphaproteobacteria bacterium]MBV8548629.1 hypothetical protein [Alphaproteobacteria bacterium]